jgi:hypothetical protein
MLLGSEEISMNRFRKGIMGVFALVVLAHSFIPISANNAHGKPLAAASNVERYGTYYDLGDARRVAATINRGEAPGWSNATVGNAEYVRTDRNGQRVLCWPVFAHHKN